MLKIQKLLNFVYQNTKERDIIKKYKELKGHLNYSKEEFEAKQLDSLNKLLNHSYSNVPYYKKLLFEAGIVKNGQIALISTRELAAVAFLNKDIIRKEKSNMYSVDINKRKCFKNSSGGSTGEPVVLLQDRNYQVNNLAHAYLVKSQRSNGPYDNAVVLWGAERDTFIGSKPFGEKIKDFILNIIRLNTFTLNEETMLKYIAILNRTRPTLIVAYVQSIYEIAKFIKKNKLFAEKQNAIHAHAGTVHDFMRKEIEEVFKCKLFNHYGSREVGAIAQECDIHDGLHILSENVYLEIIDKNGNKCKDGEKGEIVITSLHNYSMPLIRYKIGDVGISQKYENCSCGWNLPKLKEVKGRTTDLFKTKNGGLVDGEYFTHLFYYIRGIKTFQVIQEKIDLIVITIVKNGEITETVLTDIENKIKIVMGIECVVNFEFVNEIPKTKTGKFLYTISKI